MKRILPFAIIGAVLAGIPVALWYLSHSRNVTPLQPAAAPNIGSVGPVKLGANPPHMLGSIDAPVMLEEFGDFECNACAVLHPVLQQMKAEFGSNLVIVFREFPLSSVHSHALPAARAAEAAALQGKFWEMHDLLYANQKTWTDATVMFEEYAKKLVIDPDRFKRDMESQVVQQRIQLDRERGTWIGVNSTPTLFLNGREVPPDATSVEKLRALIHESMPRR